jgi:hypothetical protein
MDVIVTYAPSAFKARLDYDKHPSRYIKQGI